MEQKTVRKLEREIEDAVAGGEVVFEQVES
jgi:hypothetical protein